MKKTYEKKIYNILMFIFIILLSCNENEKLIVCGVEEPLNNLEWINELLADPSFELAEPEVYYVKHNENDYIAFYFTNFKDDFVYIYSCTGELVCQDTYSNYCEIWVEYDKKVLLSP